MSKQIAVLAQRVEAKILLIRGLRVILDSDLAELYGVEVRSLNQQIKHNSHRFPDDFVLQLSSEEAASLRSQNVISKSGRAVSCVLAPLLGLGQTAVSIALRLVPAAIPDVHF